jgi:alkanesulfonate monooxygenase SsuD/methylene tetrahydromethanopterin reductase-like flavin-dependent oxidoreductase (luciferase family)
VLEGIQLGAVILPEYPWAQARAIWQRAEDLGFDDAWTYDHLAWRSLADSTWFGALPTLVAAAATTRTIRLGALVTSPNFRHPVPLAKEVMTLDDISSGRFTLGIGAGGTGWDATVLGHAPWSSRERAERFDEFVEVLDLLLRERTTSYEGRFYSALEARNNPGCVQQPRVPFAIAATGPRGMRCAVRFGDVWVTTGRRRGEVSVRPTAGAAIVREQLDRLDATCAELGRDPRSLRRLVVTGPELDGGLASPDAFRETVGRYAEAGVTDLVVHWPRPSDPYRGDPTTFEQIFSA